MKEKLNKMGELNRRQFLLNTAKTCLGVSCGASLISANAIAQSASPIHTGPQAKNVIYLYMSGGMSHLDTFDLKLGKKEQGPTKGIKTNVVGTRLSENLPNLAANHMNKMAVINSMFSNQGAHLEGRYFIHSSYAKRGTIQHPGLGSWLLKFDGHHNPNLPGAIHIGETNPGSAQGFLDQKYAPLLVGDPSAGLQNSLRHKNVTDSTFKGAINIRDRLDKLFSEKYPQKKVASYTEAYDDALKLMQSEDLAVFELDKEPQKIRDAYGKTAFGQGCLLARRLIEKDVRFVEVTLGGWDTHTNNFERVAENSRILDQSLSALLTDLEQRGMLEKTLVVLTTEFGRTPKINANEGRDHNPTAFSSVLVGGGIQGGQFYGKSDEIGKSTEADRVNVQDFNATIAYALGLPIYETIYSATGRPFHIADKGQPILKLFS